MDLSSIDHTFLAKTIAKTGHISSYGFIILLGYIWISPRIFFYAVLSLFLSMLVNLSLKLGFKAPLKPHLGPGYSFPSGHMQSWTVFYTWLMVHVNKKNNFIFYYLFFMGLCVYGWSLCYLNFHDRDDVVAGAIVGFCLFSFIYFFLVKETPCDLFISTQKLWTILGLGAFFALWISWNKPSNVLFQYAINVFSLLAGWCWGHYWGIKKFGLSYPKKIIATFFLVLAYILFDQLKFSQVVIDLVKERPTIYFALINLWPIFLYRLSQF